MTDQARRAAYEQAPPAAGSTARPPAGAHLTCRANMRSINRRFRATPTMSLGVMPAAAPASGQPGRRSPTVRDLPSSGPPRRGADRHQPHPLRVRRRAPCCFRTSPSTSPVSFPRRRGRPCRLLRSARSPSDRRLQLASTWSVSASGWFSTGWPTGSSLRCGLPLSASAANRVFAIIEITDILALPRLSAHTGQRCRVFTLGEGRSGPTRGWGHPAASPPSARQHHQVCGRAGMSWRGVV
jgi:hypothetical protein